MPVHDGPWPDGTPCWVDVSVSDLGTARLFYEGLFGWSMQEGPAEAGGYLNCTKNGRLAAGISPKMMPEAPSAWTVYFATADLEARVRRVTDNGGQVLMGPMDVLDLGGLAICADPAGVTFGLWRPGSHLGVGVVNEPGSLIWTEQLSHSPEACVAFYRAVFDWEMHDWSSGGPPYCSFVGEGRDIGGVGGYPEDGEDLPDQWWAVLAVDDTDEAVDRVVKLGGSVIRPPADSPYGRRASVADSEGARFGLLAAPPEGYGD
ncbi:VOC family protein [Jatrophihabitans sp.]|uniref:VOC family protein n=1 Tax=Jatrophihabitans sp. TaxID=1932789 RepID=UPI002CA6578C|nr:VOC family protein [Jatrophihabitans sp.]